MIITTDKEMRDRDPFDHYPTPIGLCLAAQQLVQDMPTAPRILDPGAGTGPWGKAARRLWPAARISGVEVRSVHRPDAYDSWFTGSFVPVAVPHMPSGPFKDKKAEQRALVKYKADCWVYQQPVLRLQEKFDLIIGNPPYEYAEEFTRRSLDLLAPGGRIVFLFRLAFLEGQDRAVGLWRDHPPYRVAVCSKRPSFTGNGKTDSTAYACYYWNPHHRGDWAGGWLFWNDVPEDQLVMELV